jgi:hypothetical protein
MPLTDENLLQVDEFLIIDENVNMRRINTAQLAKLKSESTIYGDDTAMADAENQD